MIKIFDRKLDFPCLSIFPGFLYFILAHFRDNWIQPPPGVSYKIWIPVLAEIFTNYLDIMIASSSLFSNTALWLCEKGNSVITGIYPTIQDIYNVVKAKKYPAPSHLARYQESTTNRLEGLLAILGDQICTYKKLDWHKYLTTNWAIDIHNLPTVYQNLFITVTIAKILLYRIHNNLRSSVLTDLIVFDEASTIFKKWYETRGGTYLLADYLAQAREFGIGFIISTQNLTNLADSILSNSATKILIGGAGLGRDYEIFGSAVGLTKDQVEHLKTLKNPGMACVSDSRFPHPFLLEVPKVA